MPASTLFHATLFGAGLATGATTAFLLSKKNETPASPSSSSPPTPTLEHVVASSPSTQPPSPTSVAAAASAAATPAPVVYSGGQGDLSKAVFRYGFPGPIADISKHLAYISVYDRRLRHPSWTAQHLTSENIRRPSLPDGVKGGAGVPGYVDRSNSAFREDVTIPETFRASLKDYFRSGYDRGHMVPAADAKRTQEAMDQTFLLSNVAPQVGEGFNRDYWAWVEDFCRRLTTSFSDVYVFTVPLYLPKKDPLDGKFKVSYEVIGNPPSISVPTHFAKVILASPQPPSTAPSLAAFVLPNERIPDEVPLTAFQVPVEAVEKASGLLLFNDQVKKGSKDLCRSVRCDVIVRKFDDSRKKIAGPGAGAGEKR